MTTEDLRQMERFATRCNGGNQNAPGPLDRNGRCKSCSFVLELVAEVRRLEGVETSLRNLNTSLYGVATETRA